MNSIFKTTLLILIFIFACPQISLADRLLLKDGSEIRVIILNESNKKIEVLLSSGKLTYEKSDLKEIIRETPAENEELRKTFQSAESKYSRLILKKSWPEIPVICQKKLTIKTEVVKGYSYKLYLPCEYDKNHFIPIVYLIGSRQAQFDSYISLADELNFVLLFINTGGRSNKSKNMAEIYAAVLDASWRLSFDPSAQYIAGLEQNDEMAFVSASWFKSQIAGIYTVLGRTQMQAGDSELHKPRKMVLLARVYKANDKKIKRALSEQKQKLSSMEVIIKDFLFKEDKTIASDYIKKQAFCWLLDSGKSGLQIDERLSSEMAIKWHKDCSIGRGSLVFEECLMTQLYNPCTWQAYQARLMIDSLLSDYNKFADYPLSNLKKSDYAEEYLYYIAFASILAGDSDRLKSSLSGLDKIGIRNPNRASNLILALLISPHKNTSSNRIAQSLLHKALLYNDKNTSLNLVGAIVAIRNNDYAAVSSFCKRINTNKLNDTEKVVLCEVISSLAEKKDRVATYNCYKLMEF
jgi:hypothetical protein